MKASTPLGYLRILPLSFRHRLLHSRRPLVIPLRTENGRRATSFVKLLGDGTGRLLTQADSVEVLVVATDLPRGGSLVLVEGRVDFAGTSDLAPATTSIAVPAADLDGGPHSHQVTMGQGRYVRVQAPCPSVNADSSDPDLAAAGASFAVRAATSIEFVVLDLSRLRLSGHRRLIEAVEDDEFNRGRRRRSKWAATRNSLGPTGRLRRSRRRPSAWPNATVRRAARRSDYPGGETCGAARSGVHLRMRVGRRSTAGSRRGACGGRRGRHCPGTFRHLRGRCTARRRSASHPRSGCMRRRRWTEGRRRP